MVEGILHAAIYGEMLTRLCADHVGITRGYYYELELADTLKRHRTKPVPEVVGKEQVASWYLAGDRIEGLGETVFDAGASEAEALGRVLADAGW